MNRWKIVGAVTLLFLALLAFTIVESCRRVNQPQRAEEDPETLDARVMPRTPSDAAAPSGSRALPMQQVAVRMGDERFGG